MYWNAFLTDIAHSKSLSQVWNSVNKLRGVTKKFNVHPDPKAKASELMNKWSYASSYESLSSNVQDCLSNSRSKRQRLVKIQGVVRDETCVPFTKDEILYAIKKGKSSAPGRDGLTYDVINCLVSMENSPVLDLFNLSYENGRLPVKWKTALIISVPKGDKDYRPISLTSCLCKMMERMVLNRLLYKTECLLSNNLFGFLKDKSTTDCVIKCLSNVNANCRLFVDLKGAFDKVNKDVILESLVSKGVKGKLLTWITDYLTDRKGRAWFQGYESEEKSLELGTPQGGVLSPMLFNILMDRIASFRFHGESQVIIYADDILIQCKDEEHMARVIDQLQVLCLSLGLVINENKTKYQSKVVNGKEFWINGTKLQKVSSYKYLGMFVSYNNAKDQISYVKNVCTARLKPLKVLSNKGYGVGVPILRAVYLSTIRSIIDYAAPVLFSYPEKDLRPLELLQNEAMRIVLGCPRTTRIEIMRMELSIPNIIHRIRELTVISTLRLIRRGDSYLKSAVDKVTNGVAGNIKMNKYTKKLCHMLCEYNVADLCVPLPNKVYLEPWLMENVVKMDKLEVRKKDCNPYELQQKFIEKLSKYPRENVIHMYCDGSVNGNRAGCGIVIREFFEYGISVEERITKRIGNRSSSTTAELYAIYVGLKHVLDRKKTVFGFVDSQSALLALNSKVPVDDDIVLQCKKCIHDIKSLGYDVSFTWIPSHCGIYMNDVADDLAKQGCGNEIIEYDSVLSIKRIKLELIKIRRQWEVDNVRKILSNGSSSMKHYVQVMNSTNFTYGKASTKYDGLMMRLRFGYKYYWQYIEGNEGIPCKLCGNAKSHTINHYIMECNCLAEFREISISDVTQMVCFLVNKNVIKDIMKKFHKFDIRF